MQDPNQQQAPVENTGEAQEGFSFDPSAEGPEEQQGSMDAFPQGGPEEGAAQQGQGAQGQLASPDIQKIMAKLATVEADRDKLLHFFETSKPKLDQLEKLGKVFGGKPDGEPGDDLPELSPEIQADLQNPDPRISRAALSRLFGGIVGQKLKAFQEKQAQEQATKEQQVEERHQMTRAGFQLMRMDEKLRPYADWAEPIYGQFQEALKNNKQMREDHEWMNYVPKDILAPTFAFYQLGVRIARNGKALKNVLQLAGVADEANRLAMERSNASGAGEAGGGKPMTETEKTWAFAAKMDSGGL